MIIARLVGSVSVVSSKINLSMLACTILSTVELLTERLARPMERLNSGAMRQGCSISRSSEKQNFLQSIVPIPAFVCIILLTLRGLKSGQRGTTRPPDVSTNLRSPEMTRCAAGYLAKCLAKSHLVGKAQTLGDFDYRYIFSEKHKLSAFDATLQKELMRRQANCFFESAREVKSTQLNKAGEIGERNFPV